MMVENKITENKKKNITIVDVAKAAGVSISTVSRYLNSTSYVAEDKRKKIAKVIQELGYKPSRFAKGLRGKRLFVMGIITPNLIGNYYGKIVNALSMYANTKSYETIISITNKDKVLEERAFDFFLSRRVDGIIVCTPTMKTIERLMKLSVPVVAIDWSDPIGDLNIDSVTIANSKASFRVIKYLYSMGHRNILIITGNKDIHSSNERLNGILKFQEKTQDLNIYIREGNFSPKKGYFLTKEFIEEYGPIITAIFAFNDVMAFGALKALNDKNLKVPDDVSIVGFDNSFISRYTVPPLTTVEQPTKEMGITAAKILISRIESIHEKIGREIILPHKLIERESVKDLNH